MGNVRAEDGTGLVGIDRLPKPMRGVPTQDMGRSDGIVKALLFDRVLHHLLR